MIEHPATASARPAPVRHPSGGLGDNIIAVASGKGGVGKTWFSITLAHTLRQKGRNVLLFDGDLGLANVDIQLGLNPGGDLWQVVNGKASFHDIVTRDPATGIDVVTGRSGSGELADATEEDLDTLARGLALVGSMYDDVILDLGAGVDRSVRRLAANAGRILVLTNIEPTSITDAYALIKLLKQNSPATPIEVIVNSALDYRDGDRTYSKLKMACTSFLNFEPPFLGMIHQDSYVPDAIRRQVPLATRHPTSQAVADVERIASRMLARKEA